MRTANNDIEMDVVEPEEPSEREKGDAAVSDVEMGGTSNQSARRKGEYFRLCNRGMTEPIGWFQA